MPRILIFSVPFAGHMNPLYPVLRALRDSGARVTVVNDERFRERIESTGAGFRPYPRTKAYERVLERARPTSMPGLAAGLMAIANEFLPWVNDLIEEDRPDLIAHDAIACWVSLAGRVQPRPALGLVTTFAFSLGMSENRTPLRTRLVILGQLLAALPAIVRGRLTTRLRHGVAPLAIFDTFMALEEENIVFTSREFQPESHRFDDRSYFVGPTGAQRAPSVDFPYHELATDRPLVYVSFGTILQDIGLLRACFLALQDADVQVVMSLGGHSYPDDLGPEPDNFLVRGYVPQPQLLARVNAFVTHGGLNSAHEALLEGVPMVVVPFQAEEAVVARRVHETGAGLALQTSPPYGAVGADELREAVDIVLTDRRFAQRAREQGDALRASGGADRAAGLLLDRARSSVSSHRPP
jgi:MGT family glycosyltransferase